MLNKILKKLWLVGILIPSIFYFWYILKGEAVLSSDIARDFLLYSEIALKKIILIGPKSSVMGIFHGPLWLYINFPAYTIGGGNPIILELFWIFLAFLFVYSCYFVGKKLFNKNTGYLFSLMVSVYMFFHINQFYNPMGAMFLIPINFYLFIKYLEKYQIKYLIAYVLISGLIIQFELAIGIPFFILSVFYLLIALIRSKHKKHLFALLLVVIPLLNYIVFDLRHQFLLTNSVLRYLSPESGDSIRYNYLFMLYDRTKLMITNIEILRADPFYRNAVMGLIFIFFLMVQFKNNKYRKVYSLFLYFYVGFFALTLINKGPVLYFYMFPLFPFVFLIFSSFITSKYSKMFFVIFMIVYLVNLSTIFKDINSYNKNSIGKTEVSWIFLSNMANSLYQGDEKSFGYFVYTPDVIAYGPKYALFYQEKLHKDKNAFYFEKKPITYVIMAPPASNNPYLSYKWWKEERLNIKKNPVKTITFPNGYRVEKYELDEKEVSASFDRGIDPGLSFR
jgi:4-amino-4-deoxy-L-arabinose transferase-like glycosyltransferase